MLWEDPDSSCQHSKELHISQSVSMQAGFISGTFSWKRTGLAEVWVKGIGSGHSKVKVARGKGKGSKSIRSFRSEDLCSWQDGGEEGTY